MLKKKVAILSGITILVVSQTIFCSNSNDERVKSKTSTNSNSMSEIEQWIAQEGTYEFLEELNGNPEDLSLKVEGGIDKKTVAKTLRQQLKQISDCMKYCCVFDEDKIKKCDSVIMRLDVGSDGMVKNARATDINDNILENGNCLGDCLTNVMKKIIFDKTENGRETRIIYPIKVIKSLRVLQEEAKK